MRVSHSCRPHHRDHAGLERLKSRVLKRCHLAETKRAYSATLKASCAVTRGTPQRLHQGDGKRIWASGEPDTIRSEHAA